MKKERLEKVYVAPEFKKKLFHEAKIVRGVTVAELTRQLGSDSLDLEKQLKKREKKNGFEMRF